MPIDLDLHRCKCGQAIPRAGKRTKCDKCLRREARKRELGKISKGRKPLMTDGERWAAAMAREKRP